MISVFRKLYHGENSWSFQAVSYRVLLVSFLVVVLCISALLIRGLNLGVEFTGGSVWELPAAAPDSTADDAAANASATDDSSADAAAANEDVIDTLTDVAQQAGVPDARVQLITITGDDDIYRVRGSLDTENSPSVTSESVTNALAAAADLDPEQLSTRLVSPSFGDEVAGKARRALVVFAVLIALYLWARFEWKMSLGALVAVSHDVIITVGVYAIFGFEVTPATVVAFLTIMGYSLYDTIVVFDRVKSNETSLPERSLVSYSSLADVSLNQVLTRTINTSITSVLPVVSLLVVGAGFLGAGVLQEFALALLIGIIVGSYSSLFVATPIVVFMKSREAGWATAQQATEALDNLDSMSAARTALAAQRYTRTATPRPRKRGKRR